MTESPGVYIPKKYNQVTHCIKQMACSIIIIDIRNIITSYS